MPISLEIKTAKVYFSLKISGYFLDKIMPKTNSIIYWVPCKEFTKLALPNEIAKLTKTKLAAPSPCPKKKIGINFRRLDF